MCFPHVNEWEFLTWALIYGDFSKLNKFYFALKISWDGLDDLSRDEMDFIESL